MDYFGESWSAMTEAGTKIPTPTGNCIWCNEVFVEGDQGVSTSYNTNGPEGSANYHKECFLRTIVGSVGHQRKQCHCFGGTLEDPHELSLREAAIAAVREYEGVVR